MACRDRAWRPFAKFATSWGNRSDENLNPQSTRPEESTWFAGLAAYLHPLSRRVFAARPDMPAFLNKQKLASATLSAAYGDEKYTLANTKPKTARTMKAGSKIALPL